MISIALGLDAKTAIPVPRLKLPYQLQQPFHRPHPSKRSLLTSLAVDCTILLLEIDYQDGRKENIGERTGSGGGSDPMAFPHDWHQRLIEEFLECQFSTPNH